MGRVPKSFFFLIEIFVLYLLVQYNGSNVRPFKLCCDINHCLHCIMWKLAQCCSISTLLLFQLNGTYFILFITFSALHPQEQKQRISSKIIYVRTETLFMKQVDEDAYLFWISKYLTKVPEKCQMKCLYEPQAEYWDVRKELLSVYETWLYTHRREKLLPTCGSTQFKDTPRGGQN